MATKNKNEIRLNSGNEFQVKDTAWLSLGHILSGKLVNSTDMQEVVFASGESLELEGKRKCKLSVVLAQTSKDILDELDGLRGKILPVYYYNGTADGKHMEFYFPEATIVANLDLDMKGQSHQTVALELSVAPQDGNAAVNDGDLPAEAKYSGTFPVNGTNPYYVVLEEAEA